MKRYYTKSWRVRTRNPRVQEINHIDTMKEGAPKEYGQYSSNAYDWDYKSGFMKLWDSINAKRGYSWESNPWVWVIEFKKLESEG